MPGRGPMLPSTRAAPSAVYSTYSAHHIPGPYSDTVLTTHFKTALKSRYHTSIMVRKIRSRNENGGGTPSMTWVPPGPGPSGIRTIAASLKLPPSQIIDLYSMFQKQCPVVGGTPGHAPNTTDVPCDWIGWCSGVNSTECLGIDGCHPNDVGYSKIAKLVRSAITAKTDDTTADSPRPSSWHLAASKEASCSPTS